MGTFGPNAGTSFTDDSGVGTISWSAITSLAVSDGIFATAILALGAQSHYIVVTGFQFGIPLDALVAGVQIDFERQATVSVATQDAVIKLVKDNVPVGVDKSIAGQWPTIKAFQTYGSSSDTWGTTWTPTEVNNASFGIAISASALIAATAQADFVQATVSYIGSNRPVLFDRIKVGDGMACSNP